MSVPSIDPASLPPIKPIIGEPTETPPPMNNGSRSPVGTPVAAGAAEKAARNAEKRAAGLAVQADRKAEKVALTAEVNAAAKEVMPFIANNSGAANFANKGAVKYNNYSFNKQKMESNVLKNRFSSMMKEYLDGIFSQSDSSALFKSLKGLDLDTIQGKAKEIEQEYAKMKKEFVAQEDVVFKARKALIDSIASSKNLTRNFTPDIEKLKRDVSKMADINIQMETYRYLFYAIKVHEAKIAAEKIKAVRTLEVAAKGYVAEQKGAVTNAKAQLIAARGGPTFLEKFTNAGKAAKLVSGPENTANITNARKAVTSAKTRVNNASKNLRSSNVATRATGRTKFLEAKRELEQAEARLQGLLGARTQAATKDAKTLLNEFEKVKKEAETSLKDVKKNVSKEVKTVKKSGSGFFGRLFGRGGGASTRRNNGRGSGRRSTRRN